MLYLYFLEKKAHCSCSNRFSKYKTFPKFFWSCYSSSLNLENIVATPNEFFSLKNLNNQIKTILFSLLSSLYFSLFASLSKNVSHNPNTKHKTKSNSYNKVESNHANMKKRKRKRKKRTSRFDLAWWWGGGWAVVAWQTW